MSELLGRLLDALHWFRGTHGLAGKSEEEDRLWANDVLDLAVLAHSEFIEKSGKQLGVGLAFAGCLVFALLRVRLLPPNVGLQINEKFAVFCARGMLGINDGYFLEEDRVSIDEFVASIAKRSRQKDFHVEWVVWELARLCSKAQPDRLPPSHWLLEAQELMGKIRNNEIDGL